MRHGGTCQHTAAPGKRSMRCFGSGRGLRLAADRDRVAGPRLLDRLIRSGVGIDSSIARAHQHAAGARRRPQQQIEPPGEAIIEPTDHGTAVTPPVSRSASRCLRSSLRRWCPRVRPHRGIADRAYTSRGDRASLRRRGIKACIRARSTRTQTAAPSCRAPWFRRNVNADLACRRGGS